MNKDFLKNFTKLHRYDPMETAKFINDENIDFIFLHSSKIGNNIGTYSIIAYDPINIITGNDFNEIEAILAKDNDRIFLGYLGYELKNSLENLTPGCKSFIDLPNLYLVEYNNIIIFNNIKKSCFFFSKNNSSLPGSKKIKTYQVPKIDNLDSNLSKEEYLNNVKFILEAIKQGDLYQANLTRKFFGNIIADQFDIFYNLCQISPAFFSAFMKFEDNYIISSSPERFLTINAAEIITTPIKGTIARHKENKILDQLNYQILLNSLKDKAENLMITDLMRNDLSKNAKIGSVKVDKLYEITPYENIFHMSSTVSAIKADNVSNIKIIKDCFPPGSMTGTPKIKAMEICSKLEKINRGVYSGALGLISSNYVNLSVIIRTIIMQHNKFEFQVGGAVIADSTAEGERAEIITKAAAICKILNINLENI